MIRQVVDARGQGETRRGCARCRQRHMPGIRDRDRVCSRQLPPCPPFGPRCRGKGRSFRFIGIPSSRVPCLSTDRISSTVTGSEDCSNNCTGAVPAAPACAGIASTYGFMRVPSRIHDDSFLKISIRLRRIKGKKLKGKRAILS